jgi:hypothetical protein
MASYGDALYLAERHGYKLLGVFAQAITTA